MSDSLVKMPLCRRNWRNSVNRGEVGLPWGHVPRSLRLWHRAPCNGRRFFHYDECQTNEQCNALSRKLAAVQSVVPIPAKWNEQSCNYSRNFQFEVMLAITAAIAGQLTFAARVNLSPDSPTQMFRHNLRICSSRITFFLGSVLIFAGLSPAAVGFTAGWHAEKRRKKSWIAMNCFESVAMYAMWKSQCKRTHSTRQFICANFAVKYASPTNNIYRRRCTMVRRLF